MLWSDAVAGKLKKCAVCDWMAPFGRMYCSMCEARTKKLMRLSGYLQVPVGPDKTSQRRMIFGVSPMAKRAHRIPDHDANGTWSNAVAANEDTRFG